MGDAVGAAAQALVGTRFRLHGRDVASGLDCVGVVAAALRAGGFEGAVPTGYALRGGRCARIVAAIDAMLVRVETMGVGDVLLFAIGAGQFHLAIRTAGGIVHADAALRRVVERPGAPPWPVVGIWRWGDR